MERYRNLNGDSGVFTFEIGDDYIKVVFSTGVEYTYSNHKAGRLHVENMKRLAIQGAGLNAYINKNVRKLYD